MKLALSIVFGFAIIAAGYWVLFVSIPTTDEPAPADATGAATPSEPTAAYVGLPVSEAEMVAETNNVPFRVVERDGELLPTTRDYRPGRINAVVEEGVVVSYTIEGEDMATSSPPAPTEGHKQGDPDANKYNFSDGTEQSEETDSTTGAHDAIIGMTQAEAEAYAEANEVEFRIGSIDGEPRALTMDYRPGRITASLEDGVVVSYTVE